MASHGEVLFLNEKQIFADTPSSFSKDVLTITQTEIIDIDVDSATRGQFEFPQHDCHELHHAINHDAWKAGIYDHITEHVIHGAIVTDPTVSFELPSVIGSVERTPNAPPPTLLGKKAPPEGFLLNGSISLFGMDSLIADFYGYHGPLPEFLGFGESRVPIYQMATLQDDLRLSSIFPSAKGQEFDIIALKDVAITYQVNPSGLVLLRKV